MQSKRENEQQHLKVHHIVTGSPSNAKYYVVCIRVYIMLGIRILAKLASKQKLDEQCYPPIRQLRLQLNTPQ